MTAGSEVSFTGKARESSESGEGSRGESGGVGGATVLIPLDLIDPEPDQPRRRYRQQALKELAADIQRRGLLCPILVRPVGSRYQIVVGERRYRAHALLEIPRILCIVRDMSDVETRQAQLVENVLRQGLTDVERGIAIRKLYEEMRRQNPRTTWNHVSEVTGVSRSHSNDLYRLSKLPEEIVEMLLKGQLSGAHGQELSRLNGQPGMQIRLAREAARPAGSRGKYPMSRASLRYRISFCVEERHCCEKLVRRQMHALEEALRPGLSVPACDALRQHVERMQRFLSTVPPMGG